MQNETTGSVSVVKKISSYLRAQKTYANTAYFLFVMLFYYSQLNIVITFATGNTAEYKVLFYSLLFFKIGELFSFILEGRYIRLSLIGAAASVLYFSISGYTLPPLFLFWGFSMMKLQKALGQHADKKIKSYARTAGFLISPAASLLYLPVFFAAVIPCAVLCRALLSAEAEYRIRIPAFESNAAVYTVMALHNAHYFAYAFTIPFLFIQGGLPVWLAGAAFFAGWIAYNSYDTLVKPRWPVFAAGHLLVAASLIGLYFTNSISLMILLWFLTGVGGGTAYMLKPLLDIKKNEQLKDLQTAEGIGHVLGIIVWIAAAVYCSFRCTLLAGAAVALLTFLSALIVHAAKKKQAAAA